MESILSSKESETDASRECVICRNRKASYIIVPCGHQCICRRCSAILGKTACPLCAEKITDFVKVFQSGVEAEVLEDTRSRSDRGGNNQRGSSSVALPTLNTADNKHDGNGFVPETEPYLLHRGGMS